MKVLVTVASRHQATEAIAEAIAGGLAERGLEADALPIAAVTGMAGYDAVVLGSAVYLGRWLSEARRFATIHAAELGAMPVWLFSSGPLGPPDHLIPAGDPADAPVIMRLVHAKGHRTFAGRLERTRLTFGERALARAIHAPDVDSRDWGAIDAFAGEIAEELLRSRVATAPR